jgi:hypothetical protein
MQIGSGGPLNPLPPHLQGHRADPAEPRPDSTKSAQRAAVRDLRATQTVLAATDSGQAAPRRNLPRGSLIDIVV